MKEAILRSGSTSIMYSPTARLSPAFKNLSSKKIHSPVELKEKMRKDYKSRVQNSRNILLNRFRDHGITNNIHSTLTQIYESMFNFSEGTKFDVDEYEFINEMKSELVEEEFQWWLEEYDKCQMGNVDWSLLEQDENVICPVCQKANFVLENSKLSCSQCTSSFQTLKSLAAIKSNITSSLEKHGSSCDIEPQFAIVTESNESHIYLICEKCNEMEITV